MNQIFAASGIPKTNPQENGLHSTRFLHIKHRQKAESEFQFKEMRLLHGRRTNIRDHVKCGKVTDVYQLAFELHSQYTSLSEEEFAALISKITTEVKGAAALWERHEHN